MMDIVGGMKDSPLKNEKPLFPPGKATASSVSLLTKPRVLPINMMKKGA